FFITTGSPRFLDFNHTIFGQLVEGQPTLAQMTRVQKSSDGTTPASPILISSATLSNTNPDGALHIDTTMATPGQSANVTVTAKETATGMTATRTFRVTVAPNVDSKGQPINERAFLGPVENQVVGKTNTTTGENQTDVFRLTAVDAEPTDQLKFAV